MKKLVMYVYNDITTDARVQRAAKALASDFDITLISVQKSKEIDSIDYTNVLLGGRKNGLCNLLITIFGAWRIVRRVRPDVVYCHDYYSAILVYILLVTRCPSRIIYDAHELIIPNDGRSNARLSFFYWFEKQIVNKVDLIVCASEQRGEIMQKHYGLDQKPIVIPNISQLVINDNAQDTSIILSSLKDFFEKKGITVVYAGVVTTSRRVNELFDAVLSLAERYKLLIIGDGDALASLKEKAAAQSELIVAFTGKVPYKSLGSILSRCDVGFLYYPVDTLNNIYCASNKIYEYASVGLPIIANDNPTVKTILEKEKIGITTDNFKKGLQILAEKDVSFKDNCSAFTRNNKWEDMANFLKIRILSLFGK